MLRMHVGLLLLALQTLRAGADISTTFYQNATSFHADTTLHWHGRNCPLSCTNCENDRPLLPARWSGAF